MQKLNEYTSIKNYLIIQEQYFQEMLHNPESNPIRDPEHFPGRD